MSSRSPTPDSKPRAQGADPAIGAELMQELQGRLRDAVLPGEEPLAGEALAAAARFVLQAAARRAPGEPAIAIDTVAGVAGHGAANRRFMRIAVINDDMPFLVDSIAAAVAAHGIGIDRLIHPVLAVRRGSDGALLALPVGEAAAGERRESMVYLEAERADARSRRALAAALAAVLGDVRAAVHDWPALQATMAADADTLHDVEGAALLRWLNDGMLTQLGHVTRTRKGETSGELGICRRDAGAILSAASYDRAFAWFERPAARAPLIVKSNRIATVHRRTPLDLFIVPVRARGRVTALSVHAGIWTSAALAAPPAEIPRLRAALAGLYGRLGINPGGHAGKTLVHALTTLPHDIVISFEDADLERVATTMMSLIDRPRPRLALISAPLARHLFAFVWLPRDALSTATRLEIQALLEAGCAAALLDWSLEVEGNLALLRFVLDARVAPDDRTPAPLGEAALDAQLQALVRGWVDAVEAEIARSEDPARAAAIAARYAEAFPLAWRSAYGPAEAAIDIGRLRRLALNADEAAETGAPQRGVRLHRQAGDAPDRLRLKVYLRSGSLPLSGAVPALENFGFRVIEDAATALKLKSEDLGTIHDFLLALPTGTTGDSVLDRAPVIEEALGQVANLAAEDDAFNRLIPAVGLSVREADWLRALYRYMRQAGLTFGIATVVDALQGAPQVTLGLIELFRTRHDPSFRGDRMTAELAAQAQIQDGLTRVSAINDDRLLRRYRSVIEAIVRTNAFVAAGSTALAFKLDPALVPGLPRPVPWREIFVCSRQVEGVHLRAGPVARGGIRWSDRRDDFRTEVLGLMKAQRVKNAVIVPTGAKGGFYPKRLPDPAQDRERWLAEGKASYETFIAALLSLTDNIVGGKVVHPAGVVIRDGEDPYFVVAADKGTATFSDTANAIAARFDFWLDDAFASGGSKGYDHKAMGITARGAWLSVQRHFLELGVDVQTDPVLVAGCGDMSGDVFGNAMLLSQALKLVAAFDHRHIFLDPAPDPAASWAERARLAQLPRSSWADYDARLISRGGGVYPRSQKEITLSAEVRAVLGLEAAAIDPDALISAILKAPVDLLWFGGIGTYVKAANETGIAVGDPANDTLRVDGAAVRARVIGEGANLGCTQAGRIEYALAGGRINTDFIDNSAGVDCSDKEVNIKIALAAAKRAGRLTEPGRVKLLAAMTTAVAELVLEDNRLQALALSVAEAGTAGALAAQLRLIEVLAESGQLDRKTEGLAEADVLTRRAADFAGRGGLTRPELAVVMASAKLALQDALERSPVPDDPALADELLMAFPEAMRSKFRREILDHRLRREIVATRLANRIVNRLGPVHPFELAEEEGASLSQVVAAFVAAERLLALDALWQAAETAAMPEQARVALFERAASATRTHMADLLRAGVGTVPLGRMITDLGATVSELSQAAGDLLASEARGASARLATDLGAAGAPAELSVQVAHLFELDGAVGLARLARDSALPGTQLARAFIDLGGRIGLDWAQACAARMAPTDPWERLLVAGLARDFQQMRLECLRRLTARKGTDPVAAVARWADANAGAIRQFQAMVSRARSAPTTSPAMLAQLAGQARNLLAR